MDGSTSGTYTYRSTKPYAATDAFGSTMDYDLNGNLLNRTGGRHTWTAKWASFGKPRWVSDCTIAVGTVKGAETHLQRQLNPRCPSLDHRCQRFGRFRPSVMLSNGLKQAHRWQVKMMIQAY